VNYHQGLWKEFIRLPEPTISYKAMTSTSCSTPELATPTPDDGLDFLHSGTTSRSSSAASLGYSKKRRESRGKVKRRSLDVGHAAITVRRGSREASIDEGKNKAKALKKLVH
jgi:hypothetical protein